ncbi:hypothetical protein QYF36_013081 [Acer negundo]|nr:hypothetical protein QYF36_013081 [Acer negundo]
MKDREEVKAEVETAGDRPVTMIRRQRRNLRTISLLHLKFLLHLRFLLCRLIKVILSPAISTSAFTSF